MSVTRQRTSLVLGFALSGALLLSGCGGTSTTPSGSGRSSGKASVSLSLVKPGILTVGSDTSYPPMESSDPSHPGTFVGADVDLAKALAKAMGLKSAKVVNGTFDSLIPSLQSRRFDVLMSSMNHTPVRAKAVQFVDYMRATEGILVPSSSSIHANSYNDLCGKSITVERGTVEADQLRLANQTCSKKINVVTSATDTDAYQAFVSGHGDAYTSDLPVILNYEARGKGKYRVAGRAINAHTDYGVAIRKGDNALKSAVAKAFVKIRANGEYTKILQKWGVSASALK